MEKVNKIAAYIASQYKERFGQAIKLINASPGIILVALGTIILWKRRYKIKITNSDS